MVYSCGCSLRQSGQIPQYALVLRLIKSAFKKTRFLWVIPYYVYILSWEFGCCIDDFNSKVLFIYICFFSILLIDLCIALCCFIDRKL